MAKSFSDEEIKAYKPITELMKGNSYLQEKARFLATITADRKQIEQLEDRLDEYKVMPGYDIAFTAGQAASGDMIKTLTKTIERLKKLLGDCLRNMDRWPSLHEGMNKLKGSIRQALDGKEDK